MLKFAHVYYLNDYNSVINSYILVYVYDGKMSINIILCRVCQ